MAAVILCGGASRRMGASKAWLPIGGEAMLARVVRLVGEAAEPVVVAAAAGQDVPPLPPTVRLVRDEQPDLGPLEGLVTGLAALRVRADAVFLSACDTPYVRPEFIRTLASLLGDSAACVPRIDGELYPVSAVYRLDVEAEARRLLAGGVRAVRLLLRRVATREVTAEELHDVDPSLESLRNINTPDDYEQALHDFKRRPLGS